MNVNVRLLKTTYYAESPSTDYVRQTRAAKNLIELQAAIRPFRDLAEDAWGQSNAIMSLAAEIDAAVREALEAAEARIRAFHAKWTDESRFPCAYDQCTCDEAIAAVLETKMQRKSKAKP